MRVEEKRERERERKIRSSNPCLPFSQQHLSKLVADDLNVCMHISLRAEKVRSVVPHSNVSNARGHTKVKAYFSHRSGLLIPYLVVLVENRSE